MIMYVCSAEHRYTVDEYLAYWGRELSTILVPISYDRLLSAATLPEAAWIFADLERLSRAQTREAARVWAHLAAVHPPLRLLNHPARACRRYELLRRLHEAGVNDFDVYRVSKQRAPRRLPMPDWPPGPKPQRRPFTARLWSTGSPGSACSASSQRRWPIRERT